MDSYSLSTHNISSVLKEIDKWYMDQGLNLLLVTNFDFDKPVCISRYRVIKALENILQRNMSCDIQITDDLLERVSLLTN